MSNQCDNLDSLTKIPSNSISPALNHGIQFKDYQTKFSDHLAKKYGYKEGFENIGRLRNYISESNVLAKETNNIVEQNNVTNEQQQIEILREQYQEKLIKFQDLMARINGSSNNYLNRVHDNPYLGKNIHFTTGHVCYVTNQGVVKHIPNMDSWYSIESKNECPGLTFTDVNIPWLPEYDTPGTHISQLNLITGTPMQFGQSCGNAGKNVYVNTLVNNPKEKYEGCYNDKPQATDILFVPVMNSTNDVSGFKSYATSIYVNNDVWGPWAAFNRNTNYYWHSATGSDYNYNSSTGVYEGIHFLNVSTKNGVQDIKGENLQINLPQDFVLTKYDIQGRQDCCGQPNGRSPNSWYVVGWNGSQWVEVDKQENQELNYELKTYFIPDPKPYNSYVIITTNCGNPGDRTGNRYCVQIAIWNLYTSTDYGFTDDKRAMIWNPAEIGYTDLETCKKYASDNGWSYFGLQDGKEDGTAACLLSNDLASSSGKYGTAYKYSNAVVWAADVQGAGNIATLNRQGSLIVQNSSGASVYASPSEKATDYIGTYGDSGSRAMALENGGSQSYNYETCRDAAAAKNMNYFGLQNSRSGENAQCALSNDINSVIKYGQSSNRMHLSDGNFSGGGWSNSVYTRDPDLGNYYLMLYDNGIMTVSRGMSPDDNQGEIWRAEKRTEKKYSNPSFAAKKGKYGVNWMSSGSTLAAGEFIGSNTGSIYLIMQTDGNLVLYTNEKVSACSTNSKGYQVGGGWVNALYSLTPAPFKENIGKVGYVDEENVLHEYASNNLNLTNNYTKFNKVDTPMNDIPGAMYGSANVEGCKSTCDNNKDCYGFVFDNANNVCWPKTSAAWPYGGSLYNNTNIDTYVRGKGPISVPSGVTKDTVNIDSVQYQNYVLGGELNGKYGLANATAAEQEELSRLQNEMKGLSREISTLTDRFGQGTNNAQSQSYKNTKGLQRYLQENKSANVEIDKMNPNKRTREGFKPNDNIEKILQDSDIVVLQKNYDYLFWTILAAGSVIVAMNIKTSPS